jgi:hypothetical protein
MTYKSSGPTTSACVCPEGYADEFEHWHTCPVSPHYQQPNLAAFAIAIGQDLDRLEARWAQYQRRHLAGHAGQLDLFIP